MKTLIFQIFFREKCIHNVLRNIIVYIAKILFSNDAQQIKFLKLNRGYMLWSPAATDYQRRSTFFYISIFSLKIIVLAVARMEYNDVPVFVCVSQIQFLPVSIHSESGC